MKTKIIIISILSFIFVGAIWFLKTNYAEGIVKAPPVITKSVSGKDLVSSKGVQRNTPRYSSSTTVDVVRWFDSVEEYESASKYGKLPQSLSGIHVNWDLKTDDDGNFIVSTDMRDFFEFFLSAQTEEGVGTSIGRIEEYIDFVLPNSAAKEALDIFHAYLDYKKQLTRFESPKDRVFSGDKKADLITTISDVKNSLNERIDSRRKYLGEEVADIFFKEDEATDLATIQCLEIQTDDSKSAAEKEAMMAQLPVHVREFAVNKQIEALRAQGGNEEKIYALRAGLYGEEDAAILAGAEQEEVKWKHRIKNFQEAKDEFLRRSDLTDEEKNSMIEEIEKGSFSKEELLEVRLLENERIQNRNSDYRS